MMNRNSNCNTNDDTGPGGDNSSTGNMSDSGNMSNVEEVDGDETMKTQQRSFRLLNGDLINPKNTCHSFLSMFRLGTATAATTNRGVNNSSNNNNNQGNNNANTNNNEGLLNVHAVAVPTSSTSMYPVVEPLNESDIPSPLLQQQQQTTSQNRRMVVWIILILIVVVVVLSSTIGVYCSNRHCSSSPPPTATGINGSSDNKNNKNNSSPVSSPPNNACLMSSGQSSPQDLVGNDYGVYTGDIPFGNEQVQPRSSYTLRIDYNTSGIYSEFVLPRETCPQTRGMMTKLEKGFIQFIVTESMDDTCVTGDGIAELTYRNSVDANDSEENVIEDDNTVAVVSVWDYKLQYNESDRTDYGSVSLACRASDINHGGTTGNNNATDDIPTTTITPTMAPSTDKIISNPITDSPISDSPITSVPIISTITLNPTNLDPPVEIPSSNVTATTSVPIFASPVVVAVPSSTISTTGAPITSSTLNCTCESLYDSVGNLYGVFKGEIPSGTSYTTLRIFYNASGIYEEFPGFCPKFKGELSIVEKGYIQYLPRVFSSASCTSGGIVHLNDTMADGIWDFNWRYDEEYESSSGYATLECNPLVCESSNNNSNDTPSLYDSAGNMYGIYRGDIYVSYDFTYTIRIEYNTSGIFDENRDSCPLFRGQVTIAERGYIQYLPRAFKNDTCTSGGIVDLIDTMDGIWEYKWRNQEEYRTDTGYLTFEM